MSHEYTYEIAETTIPVYTTVITYPNVVIGSATKEDFSDISIVNTLNLKPVKFNKVDSSGHPVTADSAMFVLTNATSGEKVFDESGAEQVSITLSTSASDPFVIMPIQKPGVYNLTETKAPAGYNLLTMDIVVTIGASGEVSAMLGSVALDEAVLSGTEAQSYSKAFNIINKTASELPKAGGIGTLLLTLASAVVLVVAARMLGKRRGKHRLDESQIPPIN